MLNAKAPAVQVRVSYEDVVTKTTYVKVGPVLMKPDREEDRKQYEIAYVSVSHEVIRVVAEITMSCCLLHSNQPANIADFHVRIHEGRHVRTDTVVLSNDGIAKAKSSPESLNVFSLRFPHCKLVYPVAIIRPVLRDVPMKPVSRQVLREIITDVQ
jgi:hypothetical protein